VTSSGPSRAGHKVRHAGERLALTPMATISAAWHAPTARPRAGARAAPGPGFSSTAPAVRKEKQHQLSPIPGRGRAGRSRGGVRVRIPRAIDAGAAEAAAGVITNMHSTAVGCVPTNRARAFALSSCVSTHPECGKTVLVGQLDKTRNSASVKRARMASQYQVSLSAHNALR
jgi:hypothetical protein